MMSKKHLATLFFLIVVGVAALFSCEKIYSHEKAHVLDTGISDLKSKNGIVFTNSLKFLRIIYNDSIVSSFYLVNFSKGQRSGDYRITGGVIGPTYIEVLSKIYEFFLKPEAADKIGTTRWRADVDNKTITIFVWNLTPSNEKYDGLKIDGWTLNIVEDLELKNEIKKVNATLREKFGDEAAWIISIDPRTGEKSVKVFAPSVHANQKLNNTTLDGWKIYVYQSRTR